MDRHPDKGLSVVIPCYNDGEFVGAAVNSIVMQDHIYPVDIVIVDDGSTQAKTTWTLRILEGIHSNVRVIRHAENKGLPAARNTGIQAAQYEYIFTLDSDDKLSLKKGVADKGCFTDRAIDVLVSDPDTVLVYSNIGLFGAANCAHWHQAAYDEERLLFKHDVGSYVAFRRQDALAAGLQDEACKWAEDWDFVIAMVNQRIREGRPAHVERFDEDYILYRRRSQGGNLSSQPAVSSRDTLARMIARSPEIYRKHCPGIPDDQLVDYAVRKRQLRMGFEIAARALRVSFDPRSYRNGAMTYCLQTFGKKMSRFLGSAWKKAAGSSSSDASHDHGPRLDKD